MKKIYDVFKNIFYSEENIAKAKDEKIKIERIAPVYEEIGKLKLEELIYITVILLNTLEPNEKFVKEIESKIWFKLQR